MSFAEFLADLDAARLTAVLEHRPDVLWEPVPRTVRELAQRLDSVESLVVALGRVNADEVAVMRAVALGAETVTGLAGRLGRPEDQVSDVLAGLAGRGLAWRLRDRVGLPRRLAEHFAGDVLRFRPIALIANQARVDELRTAVAGLGADPVGLRKPELIDRLTALYADSATVRRTLATLPPAAREYLDLVRATGMIDYGYRVHPTAPSAVLTRAGLLVATPYHLPELPREVATALLHGASEPLTGRPNLPASTDTPDDGRAGAESALLALTTLLDEAQHRPLAALKKGGVGSRERSRLSGKVGIAEPALWIDVAAVAGLLSRGAPGYAPTDDYEAWREEAASRRWATAALGWFGLTAAPTSRETDDGEVPPPLPLESSAGLIRRALLRAAAGGRSVRAAAAEIDWFCPLNPYDVAGLARKLHAAMHEAELLGVVAGDRLTAIGEHLVAVADRPDSLNALAEACAGLLPETRGLLVLQSDLTAVVSGQPSAAAARLLAAAAVSESRGVAATWRFSPNSVRNALDTGWTADGLREELVAVSGRPLPQPLDYLIADVARRHGVVRVRGARCCVTGAESDVAEILATRSLRTLHLSRLAPTVLASPFELDDVLTRLRKAGFAPMPEDADGTVIVAERAEAVRRVPFHGPRTRRRADAAAVAARLRAGAGAAAPQSPSYVRLAELAPHLDEAEVALLADALDHGNDVHIVYRNRAGNRSARTIRPDQLYGRWVSSWCHLRAAEREFTLAGIESVSWPSP